MSNSKDLKTKVQEYYDDAATVYGDLYNDYLSLEENAVVAEIIKKYLQPEAAHVLDLGCGEGLGYTLARWRKFTGIDISPAMVKAAKKNHAKADFKVADIEDLSDFKDESFDAIISTFGSFSHVLYPGLAIDEMYRVLKPGGRAMIMVYSQYSLRNFRLMMQKDTGLAAISPIQEYKIRNLDMKGSFARFYTRKKLERLFFKFSVIKSGSINGFLELPSVKKRAQERQRFAKHLRKDLHFTKVFPNLGHSMYIIVEKSS